MTGKVFNIGAATFTTNEAIRINYIIVTASADSPNFILTDAAGNIVYEATTAVANVRYFSECLNGQSVNGLKVSAFTNILRVIIGVEKVMD